MNLHLSNLFLINFFIIAIAIVLDIIFGELPLKLHPVVYIGKTITFFEKLLYPFKNKKLGGLLLVLSTVLVVISTIVIIAVIFLKINFLLFLIFYLLIAFSLISIKSLKEHSISVYDNLKNNSLEGAKHSLSLIVSRDVNLMNKEKIITSTVESISENFVDAILSPLFYMTILGVFGGLLYKIINTLDSMVGYKNDKYLNFGYFAAKLDDLLNFIPARISILFIAIASYICEKSFFKSISTFLRFRLCHESPNSGHAMSAFAGALDITLGGPTYYFGKLVNKPIIGGGSRKIIDESVIADAINLMTVSSLTFLYLIIILIVIIY